MNSYNEKKKSIYIYINLREYILNLKYFLLWLWVKNKNKTLCIKKIYIFSINWKIKINFAFKKRSYFKIFV